MGKFIYEGGPKIDIEDRALTHLQLVMTAKLRRGEPFAFTWKEDLSIGGGRTTVWVHTGSSLVFKYMGRPTACNQPRLGRRTRIDHQLARRSPPRPRTCYRNYDRSVAAHRPHLIIALRRRSERRHPALVFPVGLTPVFPGQARSVLRMGTLEYNSSHPPVEVDDNTLAHLKIVIGTKLRRNESFMMTWLPTEKNSTRVTIWMHPSIPLVIAFDDPNLPPIEPKRVERMMEHLNARGELFLDQLA